MSNLIKWWQTIKISIIKYTAYRLNFFLQIIGPALVFLFIKYNLWVAIFDSTGTETIKGYTLSAMLTYHVWAFIVSQLAQGHTALNLALDIRMGRISTYLIYPFNFWEFHTASFLGFQMIQLCVTVFAIIFFSIVGVLPSTDIMTLLNGIGVCLFVSLFWFSLQYLTGVMAFWLEETWILRVMLQMVTVFLSGAIIPLELYPDFFREILMYTPFPYLTYYPIKVFMGETISYTTFFSVLGPWLLVICSICSITWKRGIRLYTAAGM